MQVKGLELDKFTTAYCVAMLWSSQDWSKVDNVTIHNPEPMDANYSILDIEKRTLKLIIKDCATFQSANSEDLGECGATLEQAGHDYWLTRNRHGVGFWDRSDDYYSQEQRDRLTLASHKADEQDPYIYRGKIRIDY